jgi:ferrous iron transport protein A
LLLRIVLNSDYVSRITPADFAVRSSIPLVALRPGEFAEIQQVAGPAEHVRRLEELGVRSGAVLAMVRDGSPCIIRVGGSTLCIRNDELLRVMVAPRKSA